VREKRHKARKREKVRRKDPNHLRKNVEEESTMAGVEGVRGIVGRSGFGRGTRKRERKPESSGRSLRKRNFSILSLITPIQTHFKAPLRRRNDTFFVELRC